MTTWRDLIEEIIPHTKPMNGVHVLVSYGWDDNEEMLNHVVECPDGCINTDDNPCLIADLVVDIDFVREPHLRNPGRYLFEVHWSRDYWGEDDVEIVEKAR